MIDPEEMKKPGEAVRCHQLMERIADSWFLG